MDEDNLSFSATSLELKGARVFSYVVRLRRIVLEEQNKKLRSPAFKTLSTLIKAEVQRGLSQKKIKNLKAWEDLFAKMGTLVVQLSQVGGKA